MKLVFMLLFSLAAALLVNITKKYYTDRNPSALSAGFTFNAFGSLLASVVLLCWGGFGEASEFTILLGLAFGIITAIAGITNIAALQCGPMAYTTVIISFSTLISALSGVAFFGESLGWAQVVGIVMMLISFVFAAESGEGEKKDKGLNVKWFLLCLASFVTTGGIGVMQKIHQSSSYSSELNAFLIIAFAISTVFCATFSVMLKKKESGNGEKPKKAADRKYLYIILAVIVVNGVCTAINHKINLYLSGIMNSAVFFPIVNGGGLVLATLAAVVIFKERLSKKQWIGIVFGILSVIFICDPFM